ncbi:MAG: hypothetical protein U0931_02540 [Vulcanimicrobiota bacterium]
MEMGLGEFDDLREQEIGRLRQRRQEMLEEQCRLEQFSHPQDAFEEVDPEDAHLDLQIRLFRGLARLNHFSACC